MTLLRNACLLSLALFAAVGCDDSNANPEPDDTTISTSHGSKSSGESIGGKGGSSSGSAGAKASGSAGSTATAGSKSTSNSKSSGDDAGMSVPSQPTNADVCKTGMSGCFCGAPSKDPDFLNQCTAATCNPFDNSKLKKRNADGSLPPIP